MDILTKLFHIKIFLNDTRLYLLNIVIPNYIIKSLERRYNGCDSSKCGAICCGGCDYIKNNKCTVFKNRFLKCNNCRLAPIDEFTVTWFGWKNCSYRWRKKEKPYRHRTYY